MMHSNFISLTFLSCGTDCFFIAKYDFELSSVRFGRQYIYFSMYCFSVGSDVSNFERLKIYIREY